MEVTSQENIESEITLATVQNSDNSKSYWLYINKMYNCIRITRKQYLEIIKIKKNDQARNFRLRDTNYTAIIHPEIADNTI